MIDLTVETAGVRDAQYVAAATPVPAAAERLRDPDVEILVVRDDDGLSLASSPSPTSWRSLPRRMTSVRSRDV